MDPLSIGSSALSLHQREDSEPRNDDAFREIITSCRSLSLHEKLTLKSALPQITFAIITASFHIVIGISLSFSAIFVPQIEATDSDLKLTKAESSWIASIIVLAVPVGCLIAGILMEWLGRLNTIKLAALPCVVGWILIATGNSFIQILIGRILTGLACAIGTSPAIVYITEVARPDLRSSLISICPTIASFGMLIVYIKGAFLDWRMVAWLNIFYTIVPVILMQIFVLESPLWLVSKGRIEDAARSLTYLYKGYPQPDDTTQTLADMHLQALQREREKTLMERMKNESASDLQTKKRSSWKKSKWAGFLEPTGYKPMTILFFFFLIQQFSGIYITLFFAVTFFQDVGAGIDPYTASIFVGLTRLVMSLLNAWLLKRFKRRFLVMMSSSLMALSMFCSGTVTLWIKEGSTELSYAPVLCLLVYVASSMTGLLTIPWTMTAELFPSEIRGIAHSIAYSIGNLLMFCAIQSYRTLQDYLGGAHAVQWFFSGVSIIGFFFGLFVLPETHGKKLTDIEASFRGKSKKKTPIPKTTYVRTPTLETIKESEKMMPEAKEVA